MHHFDRKVRVRSINRHAAGQICLDHDRDSVIFQKNFSLFTKKSVCDVLIEFGAPKQVVVEAAGKPRFRQREMYLSFTASRSLSGAVPSELVVESV